MPKKLAFEHINDCWNYLRKATTKEELNKMFGDLPRWSGSWYIGKTDSNNCVIINEYEEYGSSQYDREDTDIPYGTDEE